MKFRELNMIMNNDTLVWKNKLDKFLRQNEILSVTMAQETVVSLKTCHHKEIHLLEQSSVEVDTTQTFLLDVLLLLMLLYGSLCINWC